MGNRKTNGKLLATSSSEDSSIADATASTKLPPIDAWDLTEKKLAQAKSVCDAAVKIRADKFIASPLRAAEALCTAKLLIEDAQKAFKELRENHPKGAQRIDGDLPLYSQLTQPLSET